MKTRQIILSLMLISTLCVVGCGKHAKKEVQGEEESTDGGKKNTDGEGEKTTAIGAVSIGGGSELFSALALLSPDKTNENILTLLNPTKFKADAEFEGESALAVVATLRDDGFHLEPLLQNKKILETSYTKYSKAESKLSILGIVDADKKLIATKLTVGDQTFEMVDADKSNILKPKDAEKAVIKGNQVKLVEGTTDIFNGKLPLMNVKAEKGNLKKWELDPAKANYGDPITIEEVLSSTEDTVKNECILTNSFDEKKSKELGGLTSILITNFVDLEAKTITFAKFEKDFVEKLPRNIEIPVRMLCASRISPEDSKLNVITITQIDDMSILVKGTATKEEKKDEKK